MFSFFSRKSPVDKTVDDLFKIYTQFLSTIKKSYIICPKTYEPGIFIGAIAAVKVFGASTPEIHHDFFTAWIKKIVISCCNEQNASHAFKDFEKHTQQYQNDFFRCLTEENDFITLTETILTNCGINVLSKSSIIYAQTMEPIVLEVHNLLQQIHNIVEKNFSK